MYKSLVPVSYNRNVTAESLEDLVESQNNSFSSLTDSALPQSDVYPVKTLAPSYYPAGGEYFNESIYQNESSYQLPPVTNSFFSSSGFPKNVMIFRNKFVHVNVEYNHTPLAIIPVLFINI